MTSKKQLGLQLLGYLIFILLILWIVDYRQLDLNDFKQIAVLVLGTLILLLLHKDYEQSRGRFPLYLFFVALLSALVLFYNNLILNPHELTLGLLRSLKPLIYAAILYFPGNIILTQCFTRQWQESLSAREKEVYDLLKKGLSNKEIAADLYIAETTVKKHVQNIMKKAGHHDRSNL